ncbi:beta-lactamase [Corynebacterium suranareeae]|uniref:Beta-lactamase n=1 Tax=Corynebacterium suranareeae TaxID=2506452 RepID=A0A161JBR8_9CORY|nr:serine hydrolase domain-containing protein [Corynebacterium suranareeae]BAU97179.1 beta-lactamase [Corynebacterium suranareeae]
MRRHPLTITTPTAGDSELAQLLLENLPLNRKVYAACLAVSGPGGTRIATVGCNLHDTFHIGSVSKALNGLIYTDLVQEGLISPDDRLEDFLPLSGTAAGSVTLESCLTHTSGLPPTGGGFRSTLRALSSVFTGGDPQPEDIDDLIGQLRRSELENTGHFSYSNLAASALGHVLAIADGTNYPDLVHNRLAQPLSCSRLRAQKPKEQNLPHDLDALTVWNTRQKPWTGQGYAPAGVIRGSAQDFATILTTLLNENNIYDDAFRIRYTDETNSVAAGWIIDHDNGRPIAWHNGFASGFGAHMVLDRQRRHGAFISVMTPWPDPDIETIAMKILDVAP